MAYYNGPRAMNVGGMDLLNFLDIRDRDKEGDQQCHYDEPKDPKQPLESCCGDVDEVNGIGLSRKESRIPVAVRRLRARSERMQGIADGNAAGLSSRPDNDWQCNWGQAGTVLDKDDKKISRNVRKAVADNHLMMDPHDGHNLPSHKRLRGAALTGSAPQFTCVKCGRSCMMINRDGVYVALSVGVTPLLLLCLFFVCVLFGWVGLNFGFGPSVIQRLQVASSSPSRQPLRGGWIGKWFIK